MGYSFEFPANRYIFRTRLNYRSQQLDPANDQAVNFQTVGPATEKCTGPKGAAAN